MKLSQREQKFFDLATVGGKGIKEAYGEAYSHKDMKVLMSCLARKKKARPDLFAAINKHLRDLFDIAKKTQRDVIIKSATDNALHAIEKREVLRKIINDELKDDIIYFIDGKPKIVKRNPSALDKIKAIQVDCKIAGHFAPTTLVHEGGDNFIDFIKNSFKTSNKKIPDVLNETRDQ